MTTLDPRAPLVFNTVELSRRPGSMREVRRVVPAPQDLGTEVIGISADTDLDLDLRLESVREGVLVSGTIRALAVGQCVRCLEDVELPLQVSLQELVAYPGNADHEAGEFEMQGELIDVEPILRDVVVPALPFQPVCDPDCPGLCSECGARLADDPEHAHDLVDPRWSALQTLVTGAEAPEKEN